MLQDTSGLGTVEHLQMVALAHDFCFSKRICTGSDASWPNEPMVDSDGFCTEITNPIYLEAQAELPRYNMKMVIEKHIVRGGF